MSLWIIAPKPYDYVPSSGYFELLLREAMERETIMRALAMQCEGGDAVQWQYEPMTHNGEWICGTIGLRKLIDGTWQYSAEPSEILTYPED